MPETARWRVAGVAGVILLAISTPARPGESSSWTFDFGAGTPATGHTAVTPDTRYSHDTGFGLEGAGDVSSWQTEATDDRRATGLVGAAPFLLSAAVPEGIYDVTVTLGHPSKPTAVTVKAEARRLMVHNVRLEPGEFATRTFTVAVKRPLLASGKRINLKPSQPACNWDEKLTLEFNGSAPSVVAVQIEPAQDPVNVFLAGDSTVTDQDGAVFTGWGQMLPRFFKPGVAVTNSGQSGDSLRSFRGNGLLDRIWETARPGDYLFIQFGHNDQKDQREGAGAFTSYKENLEDYVAAARKRQLTVVLVTPMERRRFEGRVPQATLADYAEAVRQVGREQTVPVIDLNAASLQLYATLGPEGTKRVFLDYPAGTAPDGRKEPVVDNSHFDNYGGYELARIVATGISETLPELRGLLCADFEPFDPTQPDDIVAVALPLSPVAPPAATPEGS
ncbi:MAG: rhamnogalacturonan acetylesterase [Pirellulales bacterium]